MRCAFCQSEDTFSHEVEIIISETWFEVWITPPAAKFSLFRPQLFPTISERHSGPGKIFLSQFSSLIDFQLRPHVLSDTVWLTFRF
jgi:hypothetical protein